ncbi:MAG: hypothetical protein ABR558_11190 [Thioalkalivibrio sp.]
MKQILTSTLLTLSLAIPALSQADDREMVEMPPMMQEHMLANMRDHLEAIDEILDALNQEDFDTAAKVAEFRLGMSSLESHGASHMAQVMPAAMREMGTGMHRAASQFARTAQEGDQLRAFRSLRAVTQSCVACHAAYRIR